MFSNEKSRYDVNYTPTCHDKIYNNIIYIVNRKCTVFAIYRKIAIASRQSVSLLILYRVPSLISRAKPPLHTRTRRTYPYNIV